jgi:hypothetical protein
MIGVNLGLTKTAGKDGKAVNDKKTMHSFDACEYIKKNLKDDMSVFIRGNVDFSSYTDKDGNVRRSVKYVPNQISMCKEVEFDKYDDADNSLFITLLRLLFSLELTRKRKMKRLLVDIS